MRFVVFLFPDLSTSSFPSFWFPENFHFVFVVILRPKSIRCYLFFPFCADKNTKVILVFAIASTSNEDKCVCV